MKKTMDRGHYNLVRVHCIQKKRRRTMNDRCVSAAVDLGELWTHLSLESSLSLRVSSHGGICHPSKEHINTGTNSTHSACAMWKISSL